MSGREQPKAGAENRPSMGQFRFLDYRCRS
jgi:hypothetical protein